MKKRTGPVWEGLLSALILVGTFFLVRVQQHFFPAPSLVPAIFVLAVFLISLVTQGYLYGIAASLLSVLAVNFVFTFPYLEFNFSIPENLFSTLIMLAVAVMTGTLTTKVKQQEKMRVESTREKMRADLLRAVSHDLRTPLTSIYGSCSAVIENYDRLTKPQQLKLLQEVRGDADWLIRMVENLLSVTRIDADHVNLVKTPIVLEELIDAMLVKFHQRYPDQQVEVDIPDRFISIPMDAMLIEQVLINLLENAVFHAVGMTKLSLRVITLGERAIFEVADDGCGIPKEKLNRLFEGYLGHDTPAPDGRKSNMGIGLSVCAAIVKAHGGDIRAENQKNGGAVFRFSLKIEATEHEQQ